MPKTFFDTSAFAKLYISESGSEAAAELARDAESLVVSALVLPEGLSALRRLLREGRIGEEDYRLVKGRLCKDIAALELLSVNESAIAEAIAVIERSPVRTLDALHIGTAVAADAGLFVTSDARQAAAARAARLEVRVV